MLTVTKKKSFMKMKTGADDEDDEENASMAIAFANRSAVWIDRWVSVGFRRAGICSDDI
jgi:hypothetical protein